MRAPMVPKTLSPRAFLGLGIVLWLVAGVVWFFDATTWRQQTRAAEAYVPVDGAVVESQLRHHHRSRGSGDTWSPRIVYRYTVDGRTYENDVYAHQHIAFTVEAAAQQIVDAHPVGGPIRVHYDPSTPASSVLSTVRPTTDGMWFPWLPGACGALAIVMAYRRARPSAPGEPSRWTSA